MAGGAFGHFGHQFGDVGGLAIGMHQGGLGDEPVGPLHRRQRRHATEHAVLVGGQVAQHDRERRLIKIFHLVGGNADAHGARPVVHFGQLGAQVVQNVLSVAGVVVGDVEQPERGLGCVIGQGHLGAQLRQHQRGGHAPLRVGGVGVGKELHGILSGHPSTRTGGGLRAGRHAGGFGRSGLGRRRC